MKLQEAIKKYEKETGDKAPAVANYDWQERFIEWLIKENEELERKVAPKIGRITILLEPSDQGYPPESNGHKLSLNAIGLWYKVDSGEWRRCKRHTIFGTLQDIVQVIDREVIQ